MTEQNHYHVFLSHNSADKPAVEELARRLVKEGIQPWLDRWNLIPGEPWQEAIEKALHACDTCAVFIGPSGTGPWQNEEMRAAIDRRVGEKGFRVIPVLLPGGERPERSRLPDFLVRTTWVEFRTTLDDTDAFHRLICGIRGVEPGPGPGQAIYEGQCPYRGLRYFDVEHAQFFFGREALTEWLLDTIRPSYDSGRDNRFLAIVGASGSGKSSLARAGLIAAIKQGALPGSAEWPVVVCRPGPDPLESLIVALGGIQTVTHDPPTALDSIEAFRRDARALHIAVRLAIRNLPEQCRSVLLIDQFEEVFTLCADRELRNAFIGNLLHASRVTQGQTLVILTLRADFYAQCADHPALAAALSENQLLVGPMSAEELRMAVEMPARLVGSELESGLTEVLLRDVRGASASLPLLQHALLELWESCRGKQLSLVAYRDIGGIEGALERRAESVFARFSEDEREICRRVFLRLVQPGEATNDIGRRALVRELLPIGDRQLLTAAVIRRLAGEDARLITIESDSYNLPYVELTHDSLIRNWSRLREWIADSREDLRIARQLSEAAFDWNQHEREESYLYRGTRLHKTAEWARMRQGDLDALELDFLESALREEERDHEQRDNTSRLVAAAEAALTRVFMAADFVHHVNNLVGTIPIWVQAAREHLARQATRDMTLEGYLEHIKTDAETLLDAVKELQNPPLEQLIDVNDVLERLRNQAMVQYPTSYTIGLTCSGTLFVWAVVSELSSALWSLIVNGLQSMPEGGNLQVKAQSHVKGTGTRHIEILIRDEGVGTPGDDIEKVFQPFFTTKALGMGYGLWRAKMVVEKMGGTLHGYSNATRGMTFVVLLPAKETDAS